MSADRDEPGAVAWVMDTVQAEDLLEVLAMLEDFLGQASHDALAELAGFRLARPLDPSIWARWLGDYLGDQASALRAATHHATTDPTTPTPTSAATSTSTGELT